jgi:hypothetical protein
MFGFAFNEDKPSVAHATPSGRQRASNSPAAISSAQLDHGVAVARGLHRLKEIDPFEIFFIETGLWRGPVIERTHVVLTLPSRKKPRSHIVQKHTFWTRTPEAWNFIEDWMMHSQYPLALLREVPIMRGERRICPLDMGNSVHYA